MLRIGQDSVVAVANSELTVVNSDEACSCGYVTMRTQVGWDTSCGVEAVGRCW